MKRFLTCCLFVIVALGACASAESLIFTLGVGGTVSFVGPNGALTTSVSIPVTRASSDAGPFKNCTTCTLTFSTGSGSFTNTGGGLLFDYTFGSNNSSLAFQVDFTGAGFSVAGQTPGSPYSNGSLGSSTFQAVSNNFPTNTRYNYSPSSPPQANEQLSPSYAGTNFGALLVALGLPTNVHYSGTLTLNNVNNSPVVPGPNGSFSMGPRGAS